MDTNELVLTLAMTAAIEEKLMEEEERYEIANWVPIWVDQGVRLSEILTHMRGDNFDEDSFKVFAVLMEAHIHNDIALTKASAEFFGGDPSE